MNDEKYNGGEGAEKNNGQELSEAKAAKLRALEESGTVYQYRAYNAPQQAGGDAGAGAGAAFPAGVTGTEAPGGPAPGITAQGYGASLYGEAQDTAASLYGDAGANGGADSPVSVTGTEAPTPDTSAQSYGAELYGDTSGTAAPTDGASLYGETQDTAASLYGDTPAASLYGETPGTATPLLETPLPDTTTPLYGAPSYGGAQTAAGPPYGEAPSSAAFAAATPGYEYASGAKKPRIYGFSRGVLTAFIIIVIMACVVSGVGGGLIGANLGGRPAASSENSITINASDDTTVTEAVAQKVLNSVVGVTTIIQTQNYFGQSGQSKGEGSGIIIHSDGYILTNSHVVGDGSASQVTVVLPSGKETEAKLLWNDDAIDLAVLKVDEKGLSPVEFGDSDKVRIGSYVAAIGNPLGIEFSGSITQGVVSGLNRSIIASSDTKTTRMEGLIQVDAAINPGNSGGPLLDSKGQCIGVNTAKASAEGMGFAIPINTVKPIIDKVIATGNFERAYMGITTSNAADIAAQYPDLKLGVDTGAFINEVTISSPADKAGLIMKDVIIAVNDKKVDTSTALIKELLNYSAGDTVTITYVRNGETLTVQVTLASQSEVLVKSDQQPDSSDGSQDGGNGGFNW
ncbi:MAG: trypsin-like peptidase domain-containing protein [Clostridiales Family XIII bacterium]|jgi:S1-C subfamily serine protease|nr:trypsin-like peptidase domain-containing protein [Clostridiales Family XIII bacterium]